MQTNIFKKQVNGLMHVCRKMFWLCDYDNVIDKQKNSRGYFIFLAW